MAIVYSGGTIINDTITPGAGNPSGEYANWLITSLVAAGWTTSFTNASQVLTFSGNPSDSHTVTLDTGGSARTYTFKTAINNANFGEIFIEAALADTIDNLKNAINAGAGSGTKYSSATTVNPTMTAASDATTLTVTAIANGILGQGLPVTKFGGTMTWGSASLAGGVTNAISAKTSQGLQCALEFTLLDAGFYSPGTKLSIKPRNADGTRIYSSSINSTAAAITAAIQHRVVANRYGFFAWVVGDWVNIGLSGNCLFTAVPQLPARFEALTISAATAASPIAITTTAAHGLTTGDEVVIVHGDGLAGLNGIHTVTSTGTTTATLDGSTGTGSYTPNSARMGNRTTMANIAEAIFAQGSGQSGTWNLRTGATAGQAAWTSVNAFAVNGGVGVNRGCSDLVIPAFAYDYRNATYDAIQYHDGSYAFTEAFMGCAKTLGGQPRLVGQLYNCAVGRGLVPQETSITFDSRDWLVFGANQGANSTAIGYCLLVAVT